MDAEQERYAIDQETARIKAQVAAQIDTIHEFAARRRDTGVVLGEGKDRLYTDPLGFEAPKRHPVWSDELRHELATLRRMGEAGTVETRDYETASVEWPRATVLERFQEAVNQLPARDRARGVQQEQGRDGYGR